MYFSLNLRNSKDGGTIVCCVPLLYKWFILHLPQTPAFMENKQCLPWSQRLMSLTNDDIVWYDSALSSVDIVDSCGEFSNVPLIGTQGGINYNPALAHRQLGFPMRDKPNNTQLEGLFYQEACTIWVKKRALELKTSYACERLMSLVISEPSTLLNQDIEELEDALAKMKQEKDMWEERFHALSRKHKELQLESKEKDVLIELLEDRVVKRQRELEGPPSSSMPQPSGAWKKIVHQLVLEKAQMKTSFESKIRRIRRKYAPAARSSDNVFFRQIVLSVILLSSAKLTHRYNTQANQPKIMEHLEQENRELNDEIARLTVAISTVPVDAIKSGPSTPPGFPWGMPPNFMPEGFAPTFASILTSSLVMSVPPPVIHTFPRVEDTIYHFEPFEDPDVYEKMDGIKDQFLELRKELKTLRGKDLFGKSAAELCLVPNVKIPMKFKVPDFEKYKGNTYSASVRTFNDLGEAFVKYYKYNVDMAPDRDHPSAPNDFTEMVNMGMRLEEGIHEGRLSKEEASSNMKYGGSFSKRKEGETNSVFNLFQPRNPPQIPEPLPWWFKPELRCAIHRGALGHDIESCYPLKFEVQKLVNSGMMCFEDRAPNVKANPFPVHGNAIVNMVDGCPGNFRVFDSKDIDDVNVIVPVFKTPERVVIQFDSSSSNNINRSVSPLVIRLVVLVPYTSDKVMPYQYNSTMMENGQESSLLVADSMVNLADIVKVTRSGRVSSQVFPKEIKDVPISKKVDVPVVNLVSAPVGQSGESSKLKPNDDDEVLRLIKKSEFNVVEQLLQTPSKISVLSLLMNSEAHREAFFCHKELPEEGKNHNMALHILMNYKEDALSNMLVDIGSSLNMLPKSTLSRLSYQGTPMRYSGVIVKEFDGSHKLSLAKWIFQPWIHEAGAVTSTLHQKLKFVKNDKLVVVGGEKALLVSHLSSFSYVEAEEEVGTSFQALSITEVKKTRAPMSSFKDAQKVIETGSIDQWGRMVEIDENKNRAELGIQLGSSNVKAEDVQPSFHSGGFIHGNDQHSVAVIEDDEDEACANFVTHGQTCNNWVVVDVPVIVHQSKLVLKPIEYNDPTPSPNFDFPVFEVEEEGDDEEVSDELSRLLEHEGKAIQPFEEHIELVNLGSEDDLKEVKIGSRLCPEAKKGLIDLIREY
ncbi:hypothetical protein KIW84_071767 [Lathyrus oleraceus]|uniref:DUF7745 domain-containing protein n=1 Tax=Pisum sativum TaxID=3888 RepID=A0A9D4VL45_PEA|nr:hypothetical protein KIW84_071767 [Pisum sativum]